MSKFIVAMKKKPGSLLLLLVIVAVLIVAMAVSAIAANDPTISVGSATAEAGDTAIVVPVSIANNPGIAGFGLSFTYEEGLTLTGISKTSEGLENGLCASGSLTPNVSGGTVAFDQATNITADGVLFYLTFSVDSTAVADDYDIAVALKSGEVVANEAIEVVTVAFEAGKITVEGEEAPAAFSGSVVAAPLADQATEPQTTLYDAYSVSYLDGTASVTATNLRSHTNANDEAGYWVGGRPGYPGWYQLYRYQVRFICRLIVQRGNDSGRFQRERNRLYGHLCEGRQCRHEPHLLHLL